MDGKAFGPLLERALRQFSPDVFHHPVWVRFAAPSSPLTDDQVQQLTRATRQVQAQGDWSSACQLLILCALQQSRLGDYPVALAMIQRAEMLAERYHANQIRIWSVWGACALCAQRGDYQAAVEHLRHLQSILGTNGDWVLSDLVQLIQQSLVRLANSNAHKPPLAAFSVLTDPLLRNAMDGLLQWGQVQNDSEPEGHLQTTRRGSGKPGVEYEIKGSWFHQLGDRIRKAWYVLRGELTVTSKEYEQEALRSPVVPPVPFPEPEIISPALPASVDKITSTRSAGHFIESPAGTLFIKIAPEPTEKKHSTAVQHQPSPRLHTPRRDAPPLVIYCLGSFRVYQQDLPVADWQSQKGLSILKYLAAHSGKPVAKDILMELFWSEAECEIGRRNLHQAIYALRQTLRREQPDIPYIQFENDCYLLNPELEIWLDYQEFEQQVQSAQKLEKAGRTAGAMEVYGIAEGLYQGDFLEEDLYEDWPKAQRMFYRNMYLDLLDRLTSYYVQRREFTPAIGLCQKVLARDNCNEQAYRWLIQCYLEQGQRQLAMREYQTCLQTLKEELGLVPSPETQALLRQITG